MILTLPGQTEALRPRRHLRPRHGYIAERRVDIGSRVKKGDLLVRIAAPDLDQQKRQAEAQLGQLRATRRCQRGCGTGQGQRDARQRHRCPHLDARGQGWASKQNATRAGRRDAHRHASLTAATAKVKVAEAKQSRQQATVDRLRTLTPSRTSPPLRRHRDRPHGRCRRTRPRRFRQRHAALLPRQQ